MSDPRLDAQFAAFRRDGDPHTLAAVFDGTAPELLRVARHLAADAHAAEDLVQSTFLKAIEHRHRYDPELPVLPWLLGILANTARHERRQQNRVPPGAAHAAAVTVVEQAAQTERAARLHEALSGLPQPYREVLLLQVEHGLDSGQIAEVTGRKAATVRTQIARGMELLRAALPVGVGASLAGVLGASVEPAVALAAVRGTVLRHAAMAVTAAGGGVAAGTVLGGLAMKKVLAIAGGLMLLAAGWWWLGHGDDARVPARTPADGAPRAVASAAEPARAATDAVGEGAAARREAAAAAAAAVLRVHVQHADGSAAAGVGVYLASERLLPLGREGATNAGGVVQFDDVPLGALLVKPDRGAALPFTMVAGANDLDVRLPDGVDVEGIVRSPNGKVVIPHATVFLLSREHHDHAQQVARADANGAFSVRALPVGARLFARAAGWQPSDPKRDSVAANATGTQRIELRVGARSHTLRGRVTRADGSVAPFAQVAIAVDEDARKHVGGLREKSTGMQRQRDVDAFLLRADADGSYATDEVPEGEALVLARAAAGDATGVAFVATMVAAGADNRCDVVLQPGAQLFGTVRDEAGKPFAALPLVVAWRGTDRVSIEGAFDHLLACVTTTTDAGGNYRLPALLAGEHQVMPQAWLDAAVRIAQHGDQCERITLLAAESRRFDLVVSRRGDLLLRLVGPDGGPIAGFGIWVEANARPTPRMSQLEAQRTAADGRVRIRGLPRGEALCVSAFGPRPKEAGDRLVDRFPAKQWFDVRVQTDELVLQLDANDLPAGVLTGRFVDRHGAMLTATTGWLFRDEWNEKRGFKAPDGSFVHEALAAGRYWMRPLLANGRGRPFLGPFDVAPGQRLELGAVVVPEPARLRVLVGAADGKAVTRPRAWLLSSFPDDRNVSLIARDGAFVSTSLTPGRYRLWVAGDDLAPSVHDVELADGEERELRLELPRGFAQPFVVAANAPVAPVPPEGWVVDYSVFTEDNVLVHDAKPTALQFSIPLARGRWMVRWNVPGGSRTSTWFTLADDRPPPPIVLKPD